MKKENKISKEKIIDATVKLIAENGVNAVSMREIALKLDVTKPMLYYYFKNKEDLIKEVFHKKAEQISDVASHINADQELDEVLYSVLLNHYKFLLENPDTMKCVLKIIDSPHSSPMRKMALEMRGKNQKKIRKLLLELAKKGKIKKENIEYFMSLTSAMISFIILETRMARDNIKPGLLRQLSLIISAGIKNFKASAMFILLSVSLLPAADPGDAPPLILTVDDAVETALSKNTAVLNALENQEIYEQKIKEYWGGVYPNLSFNASYTRNIEKNAFFIGGSKIETGLDNAYSASLDLNQVLWAGGKVNTGIKMAELYGKISRENTSQARNTVKRAVRQLYYSISLFRELSKIQSENLELSRQHLNTIKEQYRQGLQSDLAVMRQEVEVSNNEPALIKAESAYEQGLLQLKNLLGLEPETAINLSEDPDCRAEGSYDPASLYAAALANRQDFKLAVFNMELAEKQVRLEKAGHWPYLSAFTSKAFSGQSDSPFPSSDERNWSLSAGIRLSLPLFSGLSAVSRVRQAEHGLKIAEQNSKDLKRKIKIELNRTLLDLKESKKRLDSQKTSVATARKALEAVELRFKNGLSSLLELNDASLALNRAGTNYIQAKHDLCYNKAQLDWELGN